MMRVIVTTHPFDNQIADWGRENGLAVSLNHFGRKVQESEYLDFIKDADVIIAGTEKIPHEVLDHAPNLKLIARVGIGLDGLDLNFLRKKNVTVTYTPDAPTMAVAELAVAQMINLSRGVLLADKLIRHGNWHRFLGIGLAQQKVGIAGFGRIGKSVSRLLRGMGVSEIFVHDINPDVEAANILNVRLVDKAELFEVADILSIHLPLTSDTYGWVTRDCLKSMKKTAMLINTARAGILSESLLMEALEQRWIKGVALDVFELEPYLNGPLISRDDVIMSCHMGSMTEQSRYRMEFEAMEDVLAFVASSGVRVVRPVPESEYQIQTAAVAGR